MSIFLPALAAFLVSAGLSLLLARSRSRFNVLDHPNERSLHTRPVPRTGGLGILGGLAAGAAVAYPSLSLSGVEPLAAIIFGAIVLATGSSLDDYFGLSPLYRLVMHFAVAGLVLYGGLSLCCMVMPGIAWIWPKAIGLLFSLLFVVWMINLYNFMDGMDGFAGGMAVFGFGAYAVLGWVAGDMTFATISMLLAAAAGGFLVFNFPPARIFMGDSGSSTLGLMAASLGLWADRKGLFPLWAAVLVFSPFIVDATVTLAGRIVRGERVWVAHKTHYYQRVVEIGWGHRRTVLWEYVAMLGAGVSAVAVVGASPPAQWAILVLWGAAYVIVARLVTRLQEQETQPTQVQ